MQGPRWPARVGLGLALAYLVCFATLSLVRYEGFHNRSFDLAIVERMLWGIRHGQFVEVFTGQPWLAYHFEPILLPLALVDGILPSPEWLLVFQTLMLTLAALPAWRLGERLLGEGVGGLVGVVCVLAYPVVGQTNVFEVHPVAFAIAPGLWLILALAENRLGRAWAAALLVCACREDGFLFVAAAIAADRVTLRRGALALAAVAAYVLWAFVLAPSLGTLAAARAHFGWLGATPAGMLATMVASPGRVLEHILGSAQRTYLLGLLAPLAFLPFLAPRRLLAALPTIGLNLLSSLPDATRIVDCHYSALAVPGLVAAAFFGGARLATWLRPWVARALLVAGAVGGSVLLGAAPGLGGYPSELYTLDRRGAELDALAARIPEDASVTVPPDVAAHFAERQSIALFPRGLGAVDFALVDLEPRRIRGVTAEDQQSRIRSAVGVALQHGYRIEAEDGSHLLLVRKP